MDYSKPQCSYKIVPIKKIAPQNLKNAYFLARLYVWFMRLLKVRLNLIYDYGSSNQDNFYKEDILNTLEKLWDRTFAHPFLEKVKKTV